MLLPFCGLRNAPPNQPELDSVLESQAAAQREAGFERASNAADAAAELCSKFLKWNITSRRSAFLQGR